MQGELYVETEKTPLNLATFNLVKFNKKLLKIQ